MRPIKILSILTITILAIATSSCKQASTETGNSLSSYEHKQNESFMLVKNNSGEFCRAPVENFSLVSSELLKPDKEAKKSPEVKMAEQEIAQLDRNEVSICDQDTISAVKQVTTGESLVAIAPAAVGIGILTFGMVYGICQFGTLTTASKTEDSNTADSIRYVGNLMCLFLGGSLGGAPIML